MSHFKLDPRLRAWMEALDRPLDRDGFLARVGGPEPDQRAAAAFWDALQAQGWMQPAQAAETPQFWVDAFASWRSQRGMMSDHTRTAALGRAIDAVVQPGMQVVDVGAGSGILSMMAARAGASRVHALEISTMAQEAEQVVADNGLAEVVQVCQTDAATFVPPEPVDLVLGEWVGMWLMEEWQHFDAFARVRDACLKAGGQVLPRAARLMISPIEDSALYLERGPGFWQRPVFGFDYGWVHAAQRDRTRRIIVRADPRCLIEPLELLRVDCRTDDSRVYAFEREFDLPLGHDGTCHGLLGWFELDLAPGVTLDTSPRSPDTHWHQSYFPIEHLRFDAGDTLRLHFRSTPDPVVGTPVLDVTVSLHRGEAEVARQFWRYTLDDTQG